MTGGDLTRLNVNGGAIARGHPMGATGIMLMSNLLGELERRQARYGLVTMCESGGTANATIIETVRQDAFPRFAQDQKGMRMVPQAVQGVYELPPQEFQGREYAMVHDLVHSVPRKNLDRSCMSMGRALTTVAAWKGNDRAITAVGPGGQVTYVTFQELEQRSNQLARAYAQFKLERNDYVVVSLPSGPEFIIACFALWKLGATPINVNHKLTFHERDAYVRLANAKMSSVSPAKAIRKCLCMPTSAAFQKASHPILASPGLPCLTSGQMSGW